MAEEGAVPGVENLKLQDGQNPPEEETEDQLITPWEVTSGSQKGVNYDKLIGEF
ncbi:Hypp9474, partial [Branchiostoma lanceolatum]